MWHWILSRLWRTGTATPAVVENVCIHAAYRAVYIRARKPSPILVAAKRRVQITATNSTCGC